MESDKKNWKLGEVVLLPRQTSKINKKYDYLMTSRYICIREASEGQRGILLKVLGETARKHIMIIKKAEYRHTVSSMTMDIIQEQIMDIIVKQKVYLDKDYSAKKLAQEIGTNTRYISAVVNTRFNMNYSQFVNKCRIDEAMRILTDMRYQDLLMSDICDMVGFATRQSFYAAFYRFVGVTPRQYRLDNLKEQEPR